MHRWRSGRRPVGGPRRREGDPPPQNCRSPGQRSCGLWTFHFDVSYSVNWILCEVMKSRPTVCVTCGAAEGRNLGRDPRVRPPAPCPPAPSPGRHHADAHTPGPRPRLPPEARGLGSWARRLPTPRRAFSCPPGLMRGGGVREAAAFLCAVGESSRRWRLQGSALRTSGGQDREHSRW